MVTLGLSLLLVLCTPDPLFYPTPAYLWDETPLADGHTMAWRLPGEQGWRGQVDLPCVDWWGCDDVGCFFLGVLCPGVDYPVAVDKFFDLPPIQEVEVGVRAWNLAGTSPDWTVLPLCHPAQMYWGF